MSDRQNEVLHFIRTYSAEHGYPPSTTDVAEHLRISRSTAHAALRRLIYRGLIRNTPGVARSFVVMKAPEVTM